MHSRTVTLADIRRYLVPRPKARALTHASTDRMIHAFIAASVLSAVTGCGMIFASSDSSTPGGVWVVAAGSLITALTGGWIAIMNARTKNKIEEMKVQMELQKTQMETQLRISTANNVSLTSVHSAVVENTRQTVKSTVAADQVKELLEQKLP